jgi:hypothetical protein
MDHWMWVWCLLERAADAESQELRRRDQLAADTRRGDPIRDDGSAVGESRKRIQAHQRVDDLMSWWWARRDDGSIEEVAAGRCQPLP